MNLSDFIKDPYNRRARLQPALLSLLPLFALTPLMYPGVEARATGLLTLAAYLGGAMWLTQLGRERGKRFEAALFKEWGGKPSVAFLRHRDPTLSDATKKRYLSFLASRVRHFRPPTADEERANPDKADQMYQAATDWLLAQTRDQKRFRLIFEENMNYGFRRNLWALKSVAIGVDLLLIAALGLYVCWMFWPTQSFGSINPAMLLALAVVVIHKLAVLSIVTKEWVKTTADAYARQLLAACDVL